MPLLPHNSPAASLLSTFFVDIINAMPEVETVCIIVKCYAAEDCRSSLHASGGLDIIRCLLQGWMSIARVLARNASALILEIAVPRSSELTFNMQ